MLTPGVVIWYMTVILAFRKWREKGHEFKVILSYFVYLRAVCCAEDLISKG